MNRTVLHIDMNCFYASVECMMHPELRDLPVAVGGNASERHGIILTKNYVAKKYGVKTGEAIWQAKKKCPKLIIVQPHYDLYVKYSQAAREIYGRYTDLIEPFGMDEVWADVTGSRRVCGDGETIAESIRKTIKSELGLTVSIGVSFNKVFAKLGSDMKKPDAVTSIPYESFREIVNDVPASDMLGVGRATAARLEFYGIHTIGQMASWPQEFYVRKFGKYGAYMWNFANGLDVSPVTPNEFETLDKSAGHGITALQDLENSAEVWKFILELSQNIGHRLMLYNKKAAGISIFVRDNRLMFDQWQCQLPVPTQSASVIAKAAFELFLKSYDWHLPIRQITVRAINLQSSHTPCQLSVFNDISYIERREKVDETVEKLRARFGSDIIRNACLLDNPKMPRFNESKIEMPAGIGIY